MPESVPDFTTFVEHLQAEGVRFVVIGGLAMIAHGSARLTFDMDISFSRSRENIDRLAKALAPLKPRPRGFPEELPFLWDAISLRSMTTSTLRTLAGDLDLLAEPEGIDGFEGLYERAVELEILGRKVKVASLDDLAAMKKAAGREKDFDHLRDIEALKRLIAEGPNHPPESGTSS